MDRWMSALRNHDVILGAGWHDTCLGKGRKHRATPLPQTSRRCARELDERSQGEPRMAHSSPPTAGLGVMVPPVCPAFYCQS